MFVGLVDCTELLGGILYDLLTCPCHFIGMILEGHGPIGFLNLIIGSIWRDFQDFIIIIKIVGTIGSLTATAVIALLLDLYLLPDLYLLLDLCL